MTIRFIEPVAESATRKGVMAPRLASLEGRKLAYIKGGANLAFWERLDELLRQRANIAESTIRIKERFNIFASKDLLDEIKGNYDAVITGVCL